MRDFAVQRIKDMAKTPKMWAYSNESFLMQLGLLIEICGLERGVVHCWLAQHGQKMIYHLNDEITDDKAKSLCMAALQAIEPTNN